MSIEQTENISEAAPFRNKVAESGIVTLDLAPFIPPADSLIEFDLKPYLFMEMILREKDYRDALKAADWTGFEGKHVGIGCSVDAIVPVWAYMLAATYLEPIAASVHFATLDELKHRVISNHIAGIDLADYVGKRVVLKGCGDVAIPESAYVAASTRLRPVVKSLMYGEPCSTVPIYKLPATKVS